MAGIYNQHQVLLFPSIWEEPFSITILEAMACGLAVIGTTTGGSREILVDGENSLTFAAGDSKALAGQIERIMIDPDLRSNISKVGERLVREKFTLDRMADQIEQCLLAAIESS
jgi:glycosyltransferase involved in cell wall biosynthesis